MKGINKLEHMCIVARWITLYVWNIVKDVSISKHLWGNGGVPMRNHEIYADEVTDTKTFISAERVTITKLTYIENNNPLFPNRTIVEYWEEGTMVYKVDPLDDLRDIISLAESMESSISNK